MIKPIQMDEILERVSGNREFVIKMLDMFFLSSDQRLKDLEKEYGNRNYKELAEQAHKLKGLIGNLSINKALPILWELHNAAEQSIDTQIPRLLTELSEAIEEAKTYYQRNPLVIQ